jgi:hypothetical protein
MAENLRLQLQILATGAGRTVGEIRSVQQAAAAAATEARAASTVAQGGLIAQSAGLAELAFRYNNVVGAIQNLVATARPAYELLIGSNEKLNAQLLSSQTNLASATRILIGGQEVTDPTAKIKATEATLRAALKQIEIDTQSLVGVTSEQVNELFQITLTNAGILNQQSKQFPDAIAAATSLTKGWAASLKVVGIPLQQARQEINSILKGQITQDSILAKNLQITNEQVNQWQAQGRLVDELNGRLNVFVAGNAIAARSIEGIGSNITDLIQRIGREAGQPLLEPIISALAAVENYLKANEQAINIFFRQFSDAALTAGADLGKIFEPLGKGLLGIGENLGPIALTAFRGLTDIFVGLSQVLAPLGNLLISMAGSLTDLAGTPIGGVVVETGVMIAAMLKLTQVVTVLGTAALPAFWGAVAFTTQTALPALWAAALTTATTLGGLSTGIAAVVSGNTALALSSPIVVASFNAITAAALPLAAALLPLAAGTGLAVLVRQTKELEDTNGALEAYGTQVLSTIDGVNFLARETKALNDARAAGAALTPQQIAREKQLNAVARIQLGTIEQQIKDQKALTGLNTDQERQRDTNIKTLEAQSKRIQKVTGGITLESKALEVLGASQEQYNKKLADAQRQIKSEGNGDSAQFKAAAKSIIDLANSGVTAKRITVAVAREQLAAIVNNTKVDLETQTAAKEAIDKLYDGRIAKIKELIDAGELQASAGLDELVATRDDATLEPATRKKAAQTIVGIRKEQIAAETAEITAGQAKIAALQAEQRIGEAAADQETTRLKLAELDKRAEATKVALENATSDTEREKLTAELQQGLADREKAEAEFYERSRKRAIEDYDERRNLLKAQQSLGLTSQAEFNRQVLLNDTAQIDLQISQQEENLDRLAKTDIEGREAIESKIAELQSKRVASLRQYQTQEIKLSNDFYDQDLKAFEAAKDGQVISEEVFAEARLKNRLEQADAEIKLQERNLKTIGAADIEGRNAIEARIYELRSKRIAAFDQLYQAELEQIRQFQAKASALIAEGETQRSILAQDAANRQLTRTEEQEQAKLNSQRETLTAQLDLAKEQEKKLAELSNATRSPEQERAYQQEVRSARTATAQLTLKLLEQEGQQIQFQRGQAIKAIEDRTAAAERSANAELGQIATVGAARTRAAKAAELAAGSQTAALERTSKALDLQNDLYQAQLGLAKAIREATAADGGGESEKLKTAIELKKRLEEGNLSEKERIIIQRQLADLTGSNTQSVYQLTQRQAELENQAALRKRTALIFEQEQARVGLNLEQRKQSLALQRSVIEARIAEIKAKQGLLDAQAALQSERINGQKTIQAAQGDVDKAEKLAPGRERDQALADAQAKLALAQQQAATNQSNAQQSIDLAQQQVGLTAESTKQILEQQNQQTEINRLQNLTLGIQQQTAAKQLEVTEAARQYANELARARIEAEGIGTALGAARPKPLEARAGGGSVNAGQAYVVGENSPEVFVPGVSGTVLNRQQVLQNLGTLAANVNVAVPQGAPSDGAVLRQLQSLQRSIESRPPVVPLQATFGSPDSAQFDEYMKAQRAMLRGQV